MADPNTATYTPSQSQVIQGVGSAFANGAGTGATDAQKQAIAGVQSAFSGSSVPSITSTPTMISSKDMAGGFASNSYQLAAKTLPTTSPTQTPPPTQVEADAKQKLTEAAANGDKPSATTGDPVLDSLQLEADKKVTQAKADADAKKTQIQTMLQTNLAANDATYAAQITSITNTYQGLIDAQTRINNLSIDRTKAYGLAGGGALGAPIEFTNAVSDREQTAAAAIQKLDNQRDSLIGQAKAAQAAGDAKLLQDSMDAIDKAEADMRTHAAQLQSEVTTRYTLLQTVEKEQQAQQQKQAQQLLAAAATKYGDLFTDATDSKKKDSLIKQVIAESGGTLDYSTVLSSLSTYATNKQAAAEQAAKDKADVAYKQAQTNQINLEEPGKMALTAAQTNAANAAAKKSLADAAKAGQPTKTATEDFFSKADQLLTLKDATGAPYTDTNGYLTPSGFKQLSAAATASGVKRSDFIDQYANKLFPGSKDSNGDPTFASYGLTPTEIKRINGALPATQ